MIRYIDILLKKRMDAPQDNSIPLPAATEDLHPVPATSSSTNNNNTNNNANNTNLDKGNITATSSQSGRSFYNSLILLQQANGSWLLDSKLSSLLQLPSPEDILHSSPLSALLHESNPSNSDNNTPSNIDINSYNTIWTTALCIAILRLKFASYSDEWEVMEKKALRRMRLDVESLLKVLDNKNLTKEMVVERIHKEASSFVTEKLKASRSCCIL